MIKNQNKDKNLQEELKDFDAIRIGVASPDEILSWSYGEVQKPETVNYRTQKPEKGGLFCEAIFGPTKDWECYCGKYKKIRYKGIICEKCGVEVTRSIVRRERMGHINLVAPCSHIWFLRSTPSRIGLMLDIPIRSLERVIYFDSYIITEIDEKALKDKLLELEENFKKKKEEIINDFKQREEEIKSLKKQKNLMPEQEEQFGSDLKRLAEEKEKTLNNLENEKENYREKIKNLKVKDIISEEDYQNLLKIGGDFFKARIGAEAIYEILSEIDLLKLKNEIKKELEKSSGQKRKHLIKRLRVVESFIRNKRRPEWMILTVLPVIPPDLRPMVQLDGGRFATADLNDLYRRVINRNNRLKKLIELGAPEIILRNEKRMLQESVDSLIDNGARGAKAVTTGAAKRKLKSLSDILKGKQGRFRQNLLGKRVDYSGRSVIVVGPNLKLNECGLPKEMALELFKPFVIALLIKNEYAHNVRSAIRLIEKSAPEVWDMLEQVINKYHVLLNRAPTLHRLGIQAFKPILIEGKAIQIHPLVCTAFNADFDGDQMAVHVPLSQKAQEEAEKIMLSTNNLLKPADGLPITIPTQDIVLGCYYLTSIKEKSYGEGKYFRDKEEAISAYCLNKVDLRAKIKVMIDNQLIEATVGRIIFNEALIPELRFVNEEINDKALAKIISRCYFEYGEVKTVKMLDKIKKIGFEYANYAGISLGIDDIKVPKEKAQLIKEAENKVEEIRLQYKQGLLTDYERYLKVLEVWMETKEKIGEALKNSLDKENSIYSIVTSGARGNIDQIIQLGGMKGLVVNPAGEIIQLPIISSFKEGFNVLEYFISTHGSRKGKSDTALRTSDSGYLTRRLVDVAQDIIVTEEDCGSNEGFMIFKEGIEDTGMTFAEKLAGRFTAEVVKDEKGEIICQKDEEITDEKAKILEQKVDKVKIRSILTCRAKHGVCVKCYGRNLAKGERVKLGEPVGVIAAQSIGEPGTQLTMRTFHRGGVAGEDITAGLPRVEELFEARIPKGQAVLAPRDGIVKINQEAERKIITLISEKEIKKSIKIKKNYQIKVKDEAKVKRGETILQFKDKIIKSPWDGQVLIEDNKITIVGKEIIKKEYPVPLGLNILVENNQEVKRGDQLTSGSINLQDLLKLKGPEEVQRYIISEIQKIYASQGPTIADKHLEVIIKKMFSKVRIKSPGDSNFLIGEITSYDIVEEENKKINEKKGKPIICEPLLLGITKAALYTESFLSAASFQETTRSLVEAAVTGKVDNLYGLKENVIIGRLIPAGTGFRKNK